MATTVEEGQDTTVPKVKKREIFGWAMYDFANSSYTTIVITAVYGAFFASVIVPKTSGMRDTYWSIAMVASSILAIILSPLAGAICDCTGRKKKYLFYTTVICSLGTMALYFINPGDIWGAILLITVSNTAFMMGESFCASFLTDLSTKENMGLISGLGWALGYFGGLACLILVQFVVTDPEGNLIAYVKENQWAMVVTGAFYFIASLFTFVLVKERGRPKPGYEDVRFAELFVKGWKGTFDVASIVSENKTLFKFFIAFTLYMAGLEVVVKFIGIYANEELDLQMSQLITLFLILQLTAAAGAFLFGFIEHWIGAKGTVMLTIAWWILGILSIYFLDQLSLFFHTSRITLFFVLSAIAGSGMGSIQSSSRTVVGLLTPKSQSAQMFGFWGMFVRFATIIGMAFGPVADLAGSRRQAILLVVGFFLAGGIVLYFVDLSNAGKEDELKEYDGINLA